MYVIKLLVFLFIPIIAGMIGGLGLYKDPLHWRKYLWMGLYVIFMLVYAYYPNDPALDLNAYFYTLELCGKLTITEILNKFASGLFSQAFLFWLIGHLNIPHLLPAITTTIVYAIAGYITCDTAERYHQEKLIGKILLFQTMTIPFVNVINNVRNVFAFSLIILAVYLDLVKKKRNIFVICLYAIGLFFHLSSFVIILLRVGCVVVKKYMAAVIIIPFVFPYLIDLSYKYRMLFYFPGNVGNGVQTIIAKMYSYMHDSTSTYALEATTGLTYRLNRYFMMAGAFILCLLIYLLYMQLKDSVDHMNYMVFIALIGVVTLACNVFAVPNYWRFAAALYVTSGFAIIQIKNQSHQLTISIRFLYLIFILLAIPDLFIQWWGARDAADYGQWFANSLLTNPCSILFNILKGILLWNQ